jgi:beta-fructofuranosidase
MDEKSLAHATARSLTQTPWEKHPHAITADLERWGEMHLWAPCVIRHENLYYMYVCVGDHDHSRYKIHLLTSPDLWTWTRHPENPMVVDGYDARDPFLMRHGGEWIMYYTATNDPNGGNHIVACRTSKDLIHWGERQVVFLDVEKGTAGGSTESPFIVQRGDEFFLFICNNDRFNGYDATDVYRSRDPFHWDRANRAGSIHSHAAEVIRDVDGKWYVTHCGWGRGGLHLAPLYWGNKWPVRLIPVGN